MLSTLADNLDQLHPSQLITLCKVILLGHEAEETGVLAQGSELIKGLEIDRFILSQIDSLDQLDLVDAVEVFADSTLLNIQ